MKAPVLVARSAWVACHVSAETMAGVVPEGSAIHSLSGRRMLEALVAGNARDPVVRAAKSALAAVKKRANPG